MKKSIGARTLIFPAPVLILGTYGQDGKPNVMNAAWGGIAASDPPTLSVAIRPSRLTWENIKATEAFTVNIPGREHVREADYFGIVSGKDSDKLADTGLTTIISANVNAPIIQEFPMHLECRLSQTVNLKSHMLVLGEIMDVLVEESCLNEEGILDIEKVAPMIYDPAAVVYREIGDVIEKAFFIGVKSFRK